MRIRLHKSVKLVQNSEVCENFAKFSPNVRINYYLKNKNEKSFHILLYIKLCDISNKCNILCRAIHSSKS